MIYALSPVGSGRTHTHDLREIFNAILYVNRTGIAWRYLPHDFPPHPTVYGYFAAWNKEGILTALNHQLTGLVRDHHGRTTTPTASIMDSQSVKTSTNVPLSTQGTDAGKRIVGRKRGIITDTTGPGNVAPEITAANKTIAACDAKLPQYRAIADAGGDPATVAAWMAEVNAQRAAALAQRDTATAAQPPAPHRLTEDNIRHLVGSFDDIRNTLRDAHSEDKSTVYRELRLALTYNPGQNKISVEATPDADYCWVTVRVRGGT
ncbi:transposase [Micromonospora sp. HUAS LYJ1]|uniref:transposase n=1 Tax=Micromonospora sp. HUAS LYJ1 TaxID=3061626 RepID=UPI00267148FE|nr:transposase [Micromonospora sp. HUAS LYJ1]WKU08494.1 transposase [Micromonospora sp. HUAS LYJ1]